MMALAVALLAAILAQAYFCRYLQRELEDVRRLVKVEGGPFITTNIRFPRRLMQYQFNHELLAQMHVHRMTPRSVAHLVHLMKRLGEGIPETAMPHSASMDVSRDLWTVVLQDESFPSRDDSPGHEIPIGTITIHSESIRRAGPESECAECLTNAMENKKSRNPF